MNDQLQLKEIAGYLPYSLRIKTKYGIDNLIGIMFSDDTDYNSTKKTTHNVNHPLANTDTHCLEFYEVKPILRPMSDLIKKIKWNGNHLIPIQHMCRKFAYNEQYEKDWTFGEREGIYYASATDPIMTRLFEYNSNERYFILSNPRDREKMNCKQFDLFQYFYENHFDFQDLIGRGLAISIHDIPTK